MPSAKNTTGPSLNDEGMWTKRSPSLTNTPDMLPYDRAQNEASVTRTAGRLVSNETLQHDTMVTKQSSNKTSQNHTSVARKSPLIRRTAGILPKEMLQSEITRKSPSAKSTAGLFSNEQILDMDTWTKRSPPLMSTPDMLLHGRKQSETRVNKKLVNNTAAYLYSETLQSETTVMRRSPPAKSTAGHLPNDRSQSETTVTRRSPSAKSTAGHLPNDKSQSDTTVTRRSPSAKSIAGHLPNEMSLSETMVTRTSPLIRHNRGLLSNKTLPSETTVTRRSPSAKSTAGHLPNDKSQSETTVIRRSPSAKSTAGHLPNDKSQSETTVMRRPPSAKNTAEHLPNDKSQTKTTVIRRSPSAKKTVGHLPTDNLITITRRSPSVKNTAGHLPNDNSQSENTITKRSPAGTVSNEILTSECVNITTSNTMSLKSNVDLLPRSPSEDIPTSLLPVNTELEDENLSLNESVQIQLDDTDDNPNSDNGLHLNTAIHQTGPGETRNSYEHLQQADVLQLGSARRSLAGTRKSLWLASERPVPSTLERAKSMIQLSTDSPRSALRQPRKISLHREQMRVIQQPGSDKQVSSSQKDREPVKTKWKHSEKEVVELGSISPRNMLINLSAPKNKKRKVTKRLFQRGSFVYMASLDVDRHIARVIRLIPYPCLLAADRAYDPVSFPTLTSPTYTGKLAYLYSDRSPTSRRPRHNTAKSSINESRPVTRKDTSKGEPAKPEGDYSVQENVSPIPSLLRDETSPTPSLSRDMASPTPSNLGGYIYPIQSAPFVPPRYSQTLPEDDQLMDSGQSDSMFHDELEYESLPIHRLDTDLGEHMARVDTRWSNQEYTRQWNNVKY